MNILIIEDDKVTLKTLQNGMENLGHKVCIAENSEEAIQHVTESKFQLILCDVMMPGISGLSLVKVLRTMIPNEVSIVVMSALNNKPLLDAAFEAGAHDFIAKPFALQELVIKLPGYTAEKISDPA